MKKSLFFAAFPLLLALLLLSSSCAGKSRETSGVGRNELETNPVSPPVTSAPEKEETTPPVTTEKEPETTSPSFAGKVLSSDGEITSTPVKGLSLRAACHIEAAENATEALFTVSLYLDHYSLSVSERAGCYLSVNGEKVKFTSPKIDREEDKKTSTLLCEHSFTLKKDKPSDAFPVEIDAAYIFNGIYANTKITDITLKEKVEIGVGN